MAVPPIQDVTPTNGSLDGSLRQTLLDKFRNGFTTLPLFKKLVPRQKFVPLLSPGDTLINTGYFISKATLERLTNAIGQHPAGGVWINFGLGQSPDRGDELQLVLTATETAAELQPTNTGKLCVTTAQIGNPTDPPFTGMASPKN
jgi:hypothetical protein